MVKTKTDMTKVYAALVLLLILASLIGQRAFSDSMSSPSGTLQTVTDAGATTTLEIEFASSTIGGGYGSTGCDISGDGNIYCDGIIFGTTLFGDGSNLSGVITATPSLQVVTDAGNTTTNWIQTTDNLYASGAVYFDANVYLGGSFGDTGCTVTGANGRLQCDGNVEGYILNASSSVNGPEILVDSGWSGSGSGSTLYDDGSAKFNSFIHTDTNIYALGTAVTSGGFGVGGCTMSGKLECDSYASATTYYGDGSNLTGLGAGTLQEVLEAGNTGSLTSSNTMELTATSTYNVLNLTHGVGAGTAFYIDNYGTGNSLGIANGGVEHFYMEEDGDIFATGELTLRPLLNTVGDAAIKIVNDSFWTVGDLEIGSQAGVGFVCDYTTNVANGRCLTAQMANTSTNAYNAIINRTNSNGPNVWMQGGDVALEIESYANSLTMLKLEDKHQTSSVIDITGTQIVHGASIAPNGGVIKFVSPLSAYNPFMYIRMDQTNDTVYSDVLNAKLDWSPNASTGSGYSQILDLELAEDFAGAGNTPVLDARQIMKVVATSTENVLIEVDTTSSGGILKLTDRDTTSATATVIIDNYGTGDTISMRDAGVDTLSIEMDGDIKDDVGGYYYLRGEGTTDRLEHGRETVTSASTGTVTFANAFSATPTITCTFYNSDDYTEIISCGHNGGTSSNFVYALSAAATGTLHWQAVGSN